MKTNTEIEAVVIAEAVQNGAALTQRIERDTAALKAINELLKRAAELGEQIPLEDAEREGRQFLAQSDKLIVPVVITADLITKSFQANSPLHESLRGLVGEQDLARLYQRKVIHEVKTDDGVKFRRLVHATLPEQEAAQFLTACVRRDKLGIPVSQTRVEWDRLRLKA